MPPSTILSSVRQPLATALAGVAGNVYSFVPESVIPPAVRTQKLVVYVCELATVTC